MQGVPSTLYGVYKRANEGTASVYAAERGVPSVGLRPHTVYGPGRDQGLTSAPTFAMLAAAAGGPYRLPFGGAYQLQYAPDVAAAFVAAARGATTGAELRDVGGPAVHTDEVIAAIAAAAPGAAITYDPVELPFPAETGGPTDARDAARRGRRRRRRALPRPPRPRASSTSPRLTVRTAVRFPLADCGPLRYPCSRKVSGLRSAGDITTPGSTTHDHHPPAGPARRRLGPRHHALDRDVLAQVHGLDVPHRLREVRRQARHHG